MQAPELSFTGVAAVAAVALSVPLLLGLAPSLRLPAVVLEILVGIVIGPSGLGWVKADLPILVLALIGIAFVLFLSGLEISFEHLKGRVLRAAAANFLVSFVLALAFGYALRAFGLITSPLLVAIILGATSLGVVVPLLKDRGQVGSEFGQLVIASSSIADFGTVILLSLFFSREATGPGAKLVILGTFIVFTITIAYALVRAQRWMRLEAVLVRLQDTTAQIRVRAAFLILAVFIALAEGLGLEVIFGAFTAGAILKISDHDRMMTHPNFHVKLEAIGFGVFIPIFFVTSGLRFNAQALLASVSGLALVPVFLAGLLIVRGLPALLYRPLIGTRQTLIAGLLQSTSLPFIVVASMIGVELGMLSAATGTALVAAGLLSVLIFPLAALTLLRREATMAAPQLTVPTETVG